MYNLKRFYPLLLMGVLIILVICPGPASAINVVGSKYMETVNPGDTVTHTIIISTTATDPPMDIVVDVLGFGQTAGQSYTSLSAADDTSPYSARKFITLDARSFHLDSGESKTITATIVIPNNVGDGGRYAIISLHNAPSGDGTTAYVTAIAVPVMITIANSNLQQTGTITGIKTGDIVTGQPIHIITSLKNTGNIHYYLTKNNVTVSDSGGNVLDTASTTPSVFAIIPTFTVNYDVSLDKTLSPGTYSIKSVVSLENGTILDAKTSIIEVNTSVVPAQVTQTGGQPAGTSSPLDVTTVLLSFGAIIIIFGIWKRGNY